MVLGTYKRHCDEELASCECKLQKLTAELEKKDKEVIMQRMENENQQEILRTAINNKEMVERKIAEYDTKYSYYVKRNVQRRIQTKEKKNWQGHSGA